MNEGPMDKILEQVRGEIRQLRPYEPEPAGLKIRLDANESPADVPADLKAGILADLQTVAWNRYPDPEARRLRTRLAEIEQVTPDHILVGNGSDEIIRDLELVFGGPGTRTVFPAPTFSMYRLLTRITGGTPVGVRLQEDWSLDEEAFLNELRHPQSRLAFIASPNNPTGNAFPQPAVERLARESGRLVVLDEAYRLFAGGSARPRLADFPNLAVLNTFSKSMSLAGIRLGYLVAHPRVIQMINRVRLPYNVDALAQPIAERALEHTPLWEAQAKRVVAERERVARALQPLPGFTVYPSQANFILVKHPQAAALKNRLAAESVAVRGFESSEGLENCLRITLGLPEENDKLLAVCASGPR